MKLGHDYFLPYSFLFIIHYSVHNVTLLLNGDSTLQWWRGTLMTLRAVPLVALLLLWPSLLHRSKGRHQTERPCRSRGSEVAPSLLDLPCAALIIQPGDILISDNLQTENETDLSKTHPKNGRKLDYIICTSTIQTCRTMKFRPP
jgi:hypothetical protein